MMISDQHQYVFMEVPHTGSTSIADELRTYYGACYFGRKHATYTEFLRHADEKQRHYFVFAGVRNPLDVAVTVYLRYRNNHDNTYEVTPGGPPSNRVSKFQLATYRFARQHEFPAYFRKYHMLPYSDGISREAKRHADFIIRYESIQDGFANLLKRLGIEQVRPLPHVNKTATKKRDFLSYYTPEIQRQAAAVFGPYMEEWGYSLPAEWRVSPPSPATRMTYRLLNMMRDAYWRYVKLHPSFVGRTARAIK